MAPSIVLAVSLVAASLGAPHAARVHSKASIQRSQQAVAARFGSGEGALAHVDSEEHALVLAGLHSLSEAGQGIDKDTIKKLQRFIASSMNLGVAIITALTEEEPDMETALETLELEGWRLVKLMVPTEEGDSESMEAAKAAWDHTFDGLPELVEQFRDSWKKGNQQAGMDAILMAFEKGLQAAAMVDTARAKYINATEKLVSGLGGAVLRFGEDMELLDAGASLVQVQHQAAAWDKDTMKKMLTTSFQILTSFVSAVSEEPPEFEDFFLAFRIQGWQMVKNVVPRAEQRKDAFKNARKAWDRVFQDVHEIASEAYEAYSSGRIDLAIAVLVKTLNTGLSAASEVDASKAKEFTAVAALIDGVLMSIMTFANEIGWVKVDS